MPVAWLAYDLIADAQQAGRWVRTQVAGKRKRLQLFVDARLGKGQRILFAWIGSHCR